MDNPNQQILYIIAKMQKYSQNGGMDCFEINEIISLLRQVYQKDNWTRLNRMMDEVTSYLTCLSNDALSFEEFVSNHIDEVAKLLNKSSRTIYRKIQNNSFSLEEKKKIERWMKDAKAE